MTDARRLSIAALLLLAGPVVGCSTNAPYAPAERASVAASTRPTLTADVDPGAASAAIAGAQPPLAPAVAIPPAPEPTATQPSSATDDGAGGATAAGRTHVVAKGETLYSIAKQYYGSGAKWKAISDANPGLRPERLPVGKTIVVP